MAVASIHGLLSTEPITTSAPSYLRFSIAPEAGAVKYGSELATMVGCRAECCI